MTGETKRRLGWWALVLGLVLMVAVALLRVPSHPTALIRVVDATGKPVAGAIVRAEGLRTKTGPFSHDWYGWGLQREGITNRSAISDTDGYATLSYPRYVFERIETGVLCLNVQHPDYVSDRPERVVSDTPPAGAPFQVWLDYIWNRIRGHSLVSKTDPIVLNKGAVLELTVRGIPEPAKDFRLFGQAEVSGWTSGDLWTRPKPGFLATRSLPAGDQFVRAVGFDRAGYAWFSEVVGVNGKAEATNQAEVHLIRGAMLHGTIAPEVRRPILHGRAIVHVWPSGSTPQSKPPEWHDWAEVDSGGSFQVGPLPPGDLEVIVVCDGFVSTNGPGQSRTMRYPQKHVFGTNDLEIVVEMEPTAALEVEVLDDLGKPLAGANVATWPNVRYGEWSATLLGGDCYRTANFFLSPEAGPNWGNKVPGYTAVTDNSGKALLFNLPVQTDELSIENDNLVLPVQTGGSGRRQGSISLTGGQTNKVTFRLEPRSKSPISHY